MFALLREPSKRLGRRCLFELAEPLSSPVVTSETNQILLRVVSKIPDIQVSFKWFFVGRRSYPLRGYLRLPTLRRGFALDIAWGYVSRERTATARGAATAAPASLPPDYAAVGAVGAGTLCLHSALGHCHTGPALSHFSTMYGLPHSGHFSETGLPQATNLQSGYWLQP